MLGTNDNQPLRFETSGTTKMSILANGNVGIGVTSPTMPLEVDGRVVTGREGVAGVYNASQVQGVWSMGKAYGVDTTANTLGNHYGFAYAHTNSGLGVAGYGHQIMGVSNGNMTSSVSLSSGHAYFAGTVTGGNVLVSGNVGIGTTNPSSKLDVRGKVRIVDGSQAAGRVLTSDANGVATWQAPSGGSGAACAAGSSTASLMSLNTNMCDGRQTTSVVSLAVSCPALASGQIGICTVGTAQASFQCWNGTRVQAGLGWGHVTSSGGGHHCL